MKKLNYLHPALKVRMTKQMGRGVFTTHYIPAGVVVEIAPVIVMSAEDREKLDQTLLHDYIFEWGDNRKQCCMALGYVPLYNHSFKANCEYVMNFNKQLIAITTLEPIKKGAELRINYNGEPGKVTPLWFPTNE